MPIDSYDALNQALQTLTETVREQFRQIREEIRENNVQVREDIRTVDVVARSAGAERLDPARLADFTLTSRDEREITAGMLP